MPAFDVYKMSDMSDFNPNTFTNPEGDDVIKIGLMSMFSGSGARNGEIFWLTTTWNAYDINKRGGLMVDGKKKKIAVFKGDTQGKPAITKKEAEKLCLEEKVDFLTGSPGSHTCLVIQTVAKKYKKSSSIRSEWQNHSWMQKISTATHSGQFRPPRCMGRQWPIFTQNVLKKILFNKSGYRQGSRRVLHAAGA